MIRTKQGSIDQLCQLQQKPSRIRNICILAHVDHGKTTLADALVASNGIISKRNAGKIRYMDSRADEQERGITMKSSAITLFYEQTQGESTGEQFLINLIDSPGHVDFSSEVTTAVRLCDGAVVVVDVVEGVCPQTHAVLRQAWLEDIRPVLVLNKVDRLVSELKMSPTEAYYHLIQVLEQVNLVTGQLFISEAMERTSKEAELAEGQGDDTQGTYDWTVIEDEEDTKNIFFSPALCNVVFASAYDGWGFTVKDFARMYASKLGMKESVLLKTLWGDFYMNMKAKRIMKGAQSKGKKPLFVQFALENIWSAYEAVMEQKDSVMTDKIVKSLGVTVTTRDTRHKDHRILLQAIMSQWLPLSHAVLDTVVTCTPSPLEVTPDHVEALMCSQGRQFSSLPESTQALKPAFLACSSSPEAPAIVYVSKMFPMERRCLPRHKPKPLTEAEMTQRKEAARQRHGEMMARKEAETNGSTGDQTSGTSGHSYLKTTDLKEEESPSDEGKEDPDDVVFIAFARVYSGVVRKGQMVFFLGPKHDPVKAVEQFGDRSVEDLMADPATLAGSHITPVEVKDLYMLMGRELEAVDEVPAGNVLGIGGLEDVVLKSGTVSTTLACPAFTDMMFDAQPIVRVAVESAEACDMDKLVAGLRLLNQADPCVEVRVQETGEHVIITAGEVHLQRCVDDLRERYAKVEVNVSKPIVPFRETVTLPPTTDMVNEAISEKGQGQAQTDKVKGEEEEEDSSILASTSDRQCHLVLRASPLPGDVPDILLQHTEALKLMDAVAMAHMGDRSSKQGGASLNKTMMDTLTNLKAKLASEFTKAGGEWEGAETRIWSFGPRRCGPNILLNCVSQYQRPSIWQLLEDGGGVGRVAEFDNSIVNGFQLASLSGPLCEEPLHGVCFRVEDWWYGGKGDRPQGVQMEQNGQNKPQSDGDLSTQSQPLKSDDSNGSVEDDLCSELKCKIEISDDSEKRTLCNGDVRNSNEDCVISNGVSDSSNEKSDYSTSHDDIDRLVHKNDESSTEESPTLQGSSNIVQRHSGVFGPLSGQLISTLKDACRRAFMAQPQRLMAAMYRCEVQATVEVLGKLHGVLSKRCGQVLAEEMQEGTDIFNVTAVLPVVESFGFADDIRKKTSGLASPQLKFSHWEVVNVDPFWVPTTEEEYTHFGEKADAVNRARVYMNTVRRRKGLKTDEKIVEFAEKQRTLTRNK